MYVNLSLCRLAKDFSQFTKLAKVYCNQCASLTLQRRTSSEKKREAAWHASKLIDLATGAHRHVTPIDRVTLLFTARLTRTHTPTHIYTRITAPPLVLGDFPGKESLIVRPSRRRMFIAGMMVVICGKEEERKGEAKYYFAKKFPWLERIEGVAR